MRAGRRKGFTLIEVLVALVLTGVVVLLVHRLLEVTMRSARVLRDARAATERRHQGERWLRLTLGSLDTSGEDGAFDGRPDALSFVAWVPVAEGWLERRRVEFHLENRELVGVLGGPHPVVLADGVERLEFDYLLEPGATTQWVQTWQSPLSAPLAVRLRVTRRQQERAVVDTMLYLIRDRG